MDGLGQGRVGGGHVWEKKKEERRKTGKPSSLSLSLSLPHCLPHTHTTTHTLHSTLPHTPASPLPLSLSHLTSPSSPSLSCMYVIMFLVGWELVWDITPDMACLARQAVGQKENEAGMKKKRQQATKGQWHFFLKLRLFTFLERRPGQTWTDRTWTWTGSSDSLHGTWQWAGDLASIQHGPLASFGPCCPWKTCLK